MKKWTLSVMAWGMALAALQGSALEAQDITGNWQGTLQAGQQKIRLLFKIALENDKLTATLYTIDRPSPPIATTIKVDGSSVKITIPGANVDYEGKLSGDGNSIAGTWAQGAPLALNLARATPATAWEIPKPPPPPLRMAADAKPSFEVATIKPSDPSRPGQIVALRGVEVITTNTTVHDLINLAYWLHPKQVTGGPAWTESQKYDMTGKPDAPGQPNVDQMKLMIQKLLADRFQLKFHWEKRDLSVYAVTIAKSGTKIVKSQDDPKGYPGWNFGRAASGTALTFRNSPMSQVTAILQNFLDKPVVDQTGLSARYDFTVTFTLDASQAVRLGGAPPPVANNPDAAPDLFAAFQQQLGLKLESTKAPVDVMVIDKVERPSEN
ncbi:MAG TPA: TIGR03435 family protein [Bryobacteraceae bacterium]|nr:TIGR03435 family protein [Bryobacteraceae bacterium]